MGFFKKPTLRTRDDQRTSAAELTLRASILPLCLVTILFFLWVRHVAVYELWLIYI
jgi:FHS family L-fucose permease-like MFS transporter